MIQTAHSQGARLVGLQDLREFDEIIDVRTPAEFQDDHIPGALNAPVLSNSERVLIGTMYAQESPFKATRLGAALVARNIATLLETTFASRARGWRPLIYCWRGGKRSGAMTAWFNLIGWRARQLDGGYKAWRRHVINSLEHEPSGLRCIILAGPTGSGKTRLLQALGRAGAQILDLEALACHRGSLLGDLPGTAQPSQRAFESRLLQTINGFDKSRVVFVEAESRRIGKLCLPQALLDAMHAGRCVRLEVELAQRIEFLLEDYQHLFAQPESFAANLRRLVGLHSRATIESWCALLARGERAALFSALVTEHYDPAYARSSQSHYRGLAASTAFHFRPSAPDSQDQASDLLRALESK